MTADPQRSAEALARGPHDALRREWLLTNALGGYAMATAAGMNARRYHGLFVAPARPPADRRIILHSLIEEVLIDGKSFFLSAHEFGRDRLVHPDGWRRLVRFDVSLPNVAEWVWSEPAREIISRRLRLSRHTNRAEIIYQVDQAPMEVSLRLRPLMPLRDFHAVDREGGDHPRLLESHAHGLTIERHGYRAMLCAKADSESVAWHDEPQWWRQFAYAEDRARGQEWLEDVWSPGFFAWNVRFGGAPAAVRRLTIRVELLTEEASDPVGLPHECHDIEHRSGADAAVEQLHCAADQFVVRRRMGEKWSTSIVAGYPWFADWGRDAMIALPGLLLVTGRHQEAVETLLTFARHMRRGLVPNRFDDYGGEAHYNTVDASLWFVRAVGLAADAGALRESSVLDELRCACRSIIDHYQQGTDHDIFMDSDGLIAAGNEQTQLTWMDARRDGVTFTPRHGKTIEVCCLWHHALHVAINLTDDDRERDHLRELATRTAASIRAQFWWHQQHCCHDVLVRGESGHCHEPDGKIRPNQIFAVSLRPSPFTSKEQESILSVVRDRLLTPFGLRTLDPADPDYRGRFEGDLFQRDAAYHQGTVWPWLLGPFGEAVLHMRGFSADARQEVRRLIEPLRRTLMDDDEARNGEQAGALGQLPEVYDGDPPHRAAGCPAQAWSVAEVLRLTALLRRSAR